MIENFIAASDVSSENGKMNIFVVIIRLFQQILTFSGGYKSNGAFSEGHYLVVASHNQVINGSRSINDS